MLRFVKPTSALWVLCLAACASRTHNQASRPQVSNAEDLTKAPAVVLESTVILFDEAKTPKCTGTLVSGQAGKDEPPAELFVFTARHCMVKVNNDESLAPVFLTPALVLDPAKEVTWEHVLPLRATTLA